MPLPAACDILDACSIWAAVQIALHTEFALAYVNALRARARGRPALLSVRPRCCRAARGGLSRAGRIDAEHEFELAETRERLLGENDDFLSP